MQHADARTITGWTTIRLSQAIRAGEVSSVFARPARS
jgi:hypothetical protein